MDVAPERTYEAVVHGERVMVKVYPPVQPKYVAWTLPSQYSGLNIDETVFTDKPLPKASRR